MWYRQLQAFINRDRIAQLSSIPLFLLLWQWLSTSEIVNSRLFPPPTAVWDAFGGRFSSGLFWSDILVSMKRVATGFFFGSIIGVLVGAVTGRFRFIANLL